MCEYALVTLNTIEYPSIYPKKPSVKYVRTLNMSDTVHSSRSLNKLLSSYQDRHIQNTVKHWRWSVLQKEQCLSAGAQPEIFQGTGGRGFLELGHFDKHFVKSTRKRGPTKKHFGSFSPRYS